MVGNPAGAKEGVAVTPLVCTSVSDLQQYMGIAYRRGFSTFSNDIEKIQCSAADVMAYKLINRECTMKFMKDGTEGP